tara:strand:- start:509 stop:781 length:273 start_codon:yes stop_codon:yes gene_type:complete
LEHAAFKVEDKHRHFVLRISDRLEALHRGQNQASKRHHSRTRETGDAQELPAIPGRDSEVLENQIQHQENEGGKWGPRDGGGLGAGLPRL